MEVSTRYKFELYLVTYLSANTTSFIDTDPHVGTKTLLTTPDAQDIPWNGPEITGTVTYLYWEHRTTGVPSVVGE